MDDRPLTRSRRRADVTDAFLVGGVEKRELFLVEHDPAADDYLLLRDHLRVDSAWTVSPCAG